MNNFLIYDKIKSRGYGWIAVPLLLFFSSCKSGPDLPVSESILVPVLQDIHIAEQHISVQSGQAKDSVARVLYHQIYALHGVEEADVDSSLAILKKDPERMKEIYEKVLEGLEQKKDSLE